MEYFIEDIDTNEWYTFDMDLMPSVHTYGKGWDKPDPLNKDYWTRDPHKAMQFDSKERAEYFLQEMIKGDCFSFCKSDVGFEKRTLIITEHEFVDKCSCVKDKECCYKCSN